MVQYTSKLNDFISLQSPAYGNGRPDEFWTTTFRPKLTVCVDGK